MGMREDLVRTDEENQRYRQLIQDNRQRRQRSFSPDCTEKSSATSQVRFSLDW